MRISLYFLSGKTSSIGVVTFSPNFLNTILHLVYYRDSTSSYLEGYLGMKWLCSYYYDFPKEPVPWELCPLFKLVYSM
jgi:hypothetical protein